MARKRAIQGEVRKRLLEGLAAGLTIKLACEYAGVSYETYRVECARTPAFHVAATRARRSHLPVALDQVRQAGKDDWRAAAEFMRLVAPEEYGRQRLELSGPDGGALKVAPEVSPEFFAAARRLLDEAVAESAPVGPDEPAHPA